MLEASLNRRNSNNNIIMFDSNMVVVPVEQQATQRPRRTFMNTIAFGCVYITLLVLLVPRPRDLFDGARALSPSSSTVMTIMTLTSDTLVTNKDSGTNSTRTPTLLLHVGPPKTSTTYLQCILTNMIDTLALDNYVFLGIQEDSQCQKTPHQAVLGHQSCYDLFVEKEAAEWNPKFLSDLRKTRSQGKNAIIINECFKFFTPAQTKLVIDEFSSHWNVKIIMNYRRAFESLPSSYNQGYKPKTMNGDSAYTLWPGEMNENNTVEGLPLRPFDIDHRGYHTRVFHDLETKGLHPVHETRLQYGEAFPDVTIIKLHELDRSSKSGDAVLQEMFCRVVDHGSMPHSCTAVQLDETVKIGDSKRNPYYSFNYDILATAAYKKQLFGFQKQQKNATRTTTTTQELTLPTRRIVAKLIQRYQEDTLNLSHHDFNTTCLSKEKLDRLLNASIAGEKVVFGSNWTKQDEVHHRQAFLTYQQKRSYTFCWINVEQTLRDPKWIAFFDTIQGRSREEKHTELLRTMLKDAATS